MLNREIVPGGHVGSEGVAVQDVSAMREIVQDGQSGHEGDAVHDQIAPGGNDGHQGVAVHDVHLKGRYCADNSNLNF